MNKPARENQERSKPWGDTGTGERSKHPENSRTHTIAEFWGYFTGKPLSLRWTFPSDEPVKNLSLLQSPRKRERDKRKRRGKEK